MRPKRRIVPSVMLLLLSMLGFLIGVIAAGVLFYIRQRSSASAPSLLSDLALNSGAYLSLLVGLLNLPALGLALRYLGSRDAAARQASLTRFAAGSGLFWLLMLIAGSQIAQNESLWRFLAPISVLSVALPAWLLVELGRRGLPRTSALREWGTLTISLTAAPLLIMLLEIILVAGLVLAAFLLIGFDATLLEQLTSLPQALDPTLQDMQALEDFLSILSNQPLITTGIFLVISVIAPLIEEILKPLAVWLLLGRPLAEREGFMLGMISGAAFTLLESASLVSQIDPAGWLPAVVLRTATAILHIGLSGILGYGMTRAWNQKSPGTAIRYLLGAVGLHGLWNAMALISGFSSITANADAFKINLTDILPLSLMILIFLAVVLITNRINRSLRLQHHNLAMDA